MEIRVILASSSPRRRELLALALENFDVIPANLEEVVPPEIHVSEAPSYLSVQKARVLAVQYPEALIIGCDTGVIVGEEMLGKPVNEEDASRMLSLLSGRVHRVITGCCLCLQGRERVFQEETYVEFYPISRGEIRSYIETGEPFDKAGGYGIQGKGALLIKGIQGDYYNVMGLPIARLIREIGLFLSDGRE